MISIFSGSREASDEEADAGEKEPGLLAFDGSLEVFGEPAIAAEPGERTFDHPALALRLESADPLDAGDDLDVPLAELCDGIAQLGAPVDPVGEEVSQLGEAGPQRAQQRHRAMNILDIGGVHAQGKQKALRISDDVALASLQPLGGIKPARAATFCGFH